MLEDEMTELRLVELMEGEETGLGVSSGELSSILSSTDDIRR